MRTRVQLLSVDPVTNTAEPSGPTHTLQHFFSIRMSSNETWKPGLFLSTGLNKWMNDTEGPKFSHYKTISATSAFHALFFVVPPPKWIPLGCFIKKNIVEFLHRALLQSSEHPPPPLDFTTLRDLRVLCVFVCLFVRCFLFSC